MGFVATLVATPQKTDSYRRMESTSGISSGSVPYPKGRLNFTVKSDLSVQTIPYGFHCFLDILCGTARVQINDTKCSFF